jgi:hypothetical protein
MSRKRCIRRHYALMNPIGLAIAGATISSEQDLDLLRMRELSAVDTFSKGAATPQDFRDVCDMLNLAETMGQSGIGPEALPVCAAVQAELLAAKARYESTGRMGLTGPGLRALRQLYDLHDQQRTAVDRSTYERAIAKTRNKIRSAHPGVKVLA